MCLAIDILLYLLKATDLKNICDVFGRLSGLFSGHAVATLAQCHGAGGHAWHTRFSRALSQVSGR